MDFLGGVLTGLTIAVVVRFVVDLSILPVIKLREAIWAVDHSLILYANCYGEPVPEELKIEAQLKFRHHAAELSTQSRALVGHTLWSRIRLVPNQAHILRAADKLISLAGLARDPISQASMTASSAENDIRRLLQIQRI
jgi:hypothetical protein